MTFIFWLQFATVCVAGAMSPGPSLALIIRNSITINRFAGFMTAVGHGLGMGVYAVFAVTGLSIILTAYSFVARVAAVAKYTLENDPVPIHEIQSNSCDFNMLFSVICYMCIKFSSVWSIYSPVF